MEAILVCAGIQTCKMGERGEEGGERGGKRMGEGRWGGRKGGTFLLEELFTSTHSVLVLSETKSIMSWLTLNMNSRSG